ncbi:MAG: acyl-CoA thioesterase [Coprobacter sp.]|nr:acyl-CoA thioesterase [Coprobacter sp.]
MNENNYCFELEMKVRDYECDMQGIVNNANYQHYLEHTRHEFLQQAGTGFTDLREKGIEPVVSRIEIDYKNSLRSQDRFTCKLFLRKEGVKFVFYQDIYRNSDNKLCIKGRVETVCINNGRLSRGDELVPYLEKYL